MCAQLEARVMQQLYSGGELVGAGLAGQQGGHGVSSRAPRSRVFPFNQGTSNTGSTLDSHSQSLQASSLSSTPEAGGEAGQSSAGGSSGTESIAMHDLKLLLTSLQHSGSAGDREAVLRQLQQMLGNAPVRPAPRSPNPGLWVVTADR